MARMFITGGTGYVGRRLVRALLELGHEVRVLTRAASTGRVPAGAAAVIGDALDAGSFQHELHAGDTLVYLVGTPHPSPAKVHWWPLALVPLYAVARLVSSLRGAEHLGLVRLDQMVSALVRAVEQPPAPGTLALIDVLASAAPGPAGERPYRPRLNFTFGVGARPGAAAAE